MIDSGIIVHLCCHGNCLMDYARIPISCW